MRITIDLLRSGAQQINAAKERELSLRGMHLEMLENLGGTNDNYESLDFSDNSIVILDGFPLLKRLKTLVLANNMISRVGDHALDNLPNLESLVLTKNRLKTLTDLLPLARIRSLRRLVLRENQVASHPHYRMFVVYILKDTMIKFLDFQRVTAQEKAAAVDLFENSSPELLNEIAPIRRSREDEKEENRRKLSPEDQRLYAKLIGNATSQEEIEELQEKWGKGERPPGSADMVVAESVDSYV